mgnify:CR=1 FL=1
MIISTIVIILIGGLLLLISLKWRYLILLAFAYFVNIAFTGFGMFVGNGNSLEVIAPFIVGVVGVAISLILARKTLLEIRSEKNK